MSTSVVLNTLAYIHACAFAHICTCPYTYINTQIKGGITGKSRNSDFTLDKISLSTSIINCNKLGARHSEMRVHNADGHRRLLTEE